MIDLAHASIHGLTCLSDGSWKIVLRSQELSPEEVKQLSSALQEGKQLTTRITPRLEESKSPAERLKGLLYKIYKEHNLEGDFDAYYRGELEKIISHFKSKL